jgi:hypothetical protein
MARSSRCEPAEEWLRSMLCFFLPAVAAITSHTSEGSLDNPPFLRDDKLLSVRGPQHFSQELRSVIAATHATRPDGGGA